MTNKPIRTVADVAEAYIAQQRSSARASALSYISQTAYSYTTPVAQLETPSAVYATPCLFLTSQDYSQTTNAHLTKIHSAFLRRYGADALVVAVPAPRATTADGNVRYLIDTINAYLISATNKRFKHISAKLTQLEYAEKGYVTLATLLDKHYPYWMPQDDAVHDGMLELHNIFHDLPTQSADTPSNFRFVPKPVHTPETLTALLNLRAIRALEK